MLTLPDKLLIISLAILTLFSYKIANGARQGNEVRVEVNGKVFGSYPLGKDSVHEVTGPLGTSRIGITEGKVSFLSSPCRNRNCIHQGRIGRSGQTAVCLPNRVVIRVTGDDAEYDAITR